MRRLNVAANGRASTHYKIRLYMARSWMQDNTNIKDQNRKEVRMNHNENSNDPTLAVGGKKGDYP